MAHLKLLILSAALYFGSAIYYTKYVEPKYAYRLKITTPEDLRAYFSYTNEHVPLISTHRGGAQKGWPEECIETFEHTLEIAPSTIEIDPRFTRDSVMVLMHDPTIDRTTNGTGKVSDYTWEELKNFRLKDKFGTLTNYRIPTLDSVLNWAKGKTVVMIDQKDIPYQLLEKKIRQLDAAANAIPVVKSVEAAQLYHEKNRDLMIAVYLPEIDNVIEADKSGIPWPNLLAYVGFKEAESAKVVDMIHKRGALCLFKAGRISDKEFLDGRISIYDELLKRGFDVIETNLTSEAYASIRKVASKHSFKTKFITRIYLK